MSQRDFEFKVISRTNVMSTLFKFRPLWMGNSALGETELTPPKTTCSQSFWSLLSFSGSMVTVPGGKGPFDSLIVVRT